MIKFWHEIGTILELKILERSEIALFLLEKDNFFDKNISGRFQTFRSEISKI